MVCVTSMCKKNNQWTGVLAANPPALFGAAKRTKLSTYEHAIEGADCLLGLQTHKCDRARSVSWAQD